MRKILYNMFIIMILFICSMSLVSCEAITAQNITNTASPGMNGGPAMKNGPRENGNPGMNSKQGTNSKQGMNGNRSDNGNSKVE